MSTEKIISAEEKNIINLDILETKEKVLTGRVDINHLLARVRKEKEKNNFTNLVFAGLCLTLVLVVGIILSF